WRRPKRSAPTARELGVGSWLRRSWELGVGSWGRQGQRQARLCRPQLPTPNPSPPPFQLLTPNSQLTTKSSTCWTRWWIARWSRAAVASGQWSAVGAGKDPGRAEPVVDLAGLTTDHWPLTTALEIGLRLGTALVGFWLCRGPMEEGREHLEALLAPLGRPSL